MMFPFGTPVAEPTSDAIQTRRAMAHHVSSIVVLSTRWSVVRSCAYVHRDRTRVGAFPPGIFQRARAAFPDGYRRKHMGCVRDYAFRRISPMHVR